MGYNVVAWKEVKGEADDVDKKGNPIIYHEPMVSSVTTDAMKTSTIQTHSVVLFLTVGYTVRASKGVNNASELPDVSPATISFKMCGCHIAPGKSKIAPPGIRGSKGNM